MKKFSLTRNQRRFLILWTAFHLLALVVNIIPMKGEIVSSDNTIYYALTEADDTEDFWPFTTYVIKGYSLKQRGAMTVGTAHLDPSKSENFMGVFNQYDISEFLVYVLGAVALLLVPKLW